MLRGVSFPFSIEQQIPPQVSAIRPILQELDFFIASGMDPSPDWFRPVSTPEAGVVGGVPQSRSNGSLKRFPPQQLPPSKCQSPMTSLYTSMIQSSKPEPTPRTAPLSTRPARQISSASERLEVTVSSTYPPFALPLASSDKF